MLRAIDIMTRNVVDVPQATSVQAAAQIMQQEHIGSVIVVENGRPIGIVTETDFTRKVGAGAVPVTKGVKDIMTSPLIYASSDADILEVANAMSENNIKKIPILDGHSVLGIVTQTDVVKHIFRSVRTLQRQFELGTINGRELAQKSNELFQDYGAQFVEETKHWYMRCKDCGNSFVNPEKQGRFKITTCPKCGSHQLDYDKTPSI